MGMGMRWSRQPDLEVVPRFDRNGDGLLNDWERQAAREYVVDERNSQNLSTGGHPPIPIRTDLSTDLQQSAAAAVLGNIDLYDEKTLRTLYLRFPSPDWVQEMADFFKTDVEIPADLIVDGKLYPQVGVRFRGNSSYFMLGNSLKKSFSISINYADEDQRLYGYRTLDLLNGHADPSLIRTVLFSRISRQYIPAPKANFVKLVINGENWGVYINVQQFNSDFVREWFETTSGVRWKVPAGRNSGGGLMYNGPDPGSYRRSFEIQTKDTPEAWQDLITLCDILTNTPAEELEQRLSTVFAIDSALWFLALENAFIDSDGYISRGSDYYLYQDPQGRFTMITHDNNETFRYAGGGGPNRWPSSDPMLSPVGHEDTSSLPVISRLLAIPHLRARYLAHLRTIVEQWLDWSVLAPIIQEYQTLIAAEVEKDDKKLSSNSAFAGSVSEDSGYGRFGAPSFERFVRERREFLLSHPEIDREAPEISLLQHEDSPSIDTAIKVKAKVHPIAGTGVVLLYYAVGNDRRFSNVIMHDDGRLGDEIAGDGEFAGFIPAVPQGTQVRYYVEARTTGSVGTASFKPAGSEWGARTFRSGLSKVEHSPVVINELMALNSRSVSDPQGEFDDWIELYNWGNFEVDLSGMYLSDRANDLRKWMIPNGTTIPPGGFLLVWADEDNGEGLHANFKLSGGGEQVLLIDTDARGNRVLDFVEFGFQREDISYGRWPDGSGNFQSLYQSPGRSNGSK
jgi:hypothetical protein